MQLSSKLPPSLQALTYFIILIYASVSFSEEADTASLESDLWLPISYQQHFPRLLEAAEKVYQNEYCQDFLDGSLSETLSSSHDIVFIFRCRTEERRLFTITVDEKTLTLKNSLEEWIRQEALEKELREKEELRKKLAEREKYWAICHIVFKRKASLFNSAKIKTLLPPTPDISETGEFTYYIEFQTLSSKKTVLSYLATAIISSLDECVVDIRTL
ncbi:hypothetical protein IMCC1989_1483 [gamma proteobacterium IMCC1989]|nr:hypothetical protein IMCC1989_1483 [gamma proteobacterium IMCC1989]